ncbi:MAG: hypothetical protein IPN62_18825 [Flavobacteriales bacterium]|nr:hypothetical protein [Flavobacteriales bacterium]
MALNTKGGFVKEVRSRGPACNSDHCPFVQRGVLALFLSTLGGQRTTTMCWIPLPALTEFADIHALLRPSSASIK